MKNSNTRQQKKTMNATALKPLQTETDKLELLEVGTDVTMEDVTVAEERKEDQEKEHETIEVHSDDDDVDMMMQETKLMPNFSSVKVKKEYLDKAESHDEAPALDSEEDTVVSTKRKAEDPPEERRKNDQTKPQEQKPESNFTDSRSQQLDSDKWDDDHSRSQEARDRQREKEDKEDEEIMAAFTPDPASAEHIRDRKKNTIDRSESSYCGDWKTVTALTNEKKEKHLKEHPVDADIIVPAQVQVRAKAASAPHSKGLESQKTRFKQEVMENRVRDKRRESNKTKTRRTFTSAEEAVAQQKEPEDMSARYESAETVRHVYFLSFDLYAEKQQSYANVIQLLLDKILDHDKEANIKAYLRNSHYPDIGWGTQISETCYTRSQFREYFYEVWDTSARGTKNGPYRVHGKMRLESALEYTVLKGRMMNWLTEKRHFLHKPFVQTEKVIKLGLLLGSSTAQHRLEVQRQIEQAVLEDTGKYIQIEVQKKIERFRGKRGGTESTPILIVEAGVEHKDDVEESLKKIFKSGKPSPIGRRVSFIPSPNKTTRSTSAYNRLMQRQKEMNQSERATATDQIVDARKKVHIKEGTELTVQQIICGMTDHNNNKIFTGAEIMGKSDKTLLTYNVNMEVIARMTATHIAEAVKRLIDEKDHSEVEDERKIASKETRERQHEEDQSYISGISSEWGYESQSEEGESVSTMSSLTGLDSVSQVLNFSTAAKRDSPQQQETTSAVTVNQWQRAPEDREGGIGTNSTKITRQQQDIDKQIIGEKQQYTQLEEVQRRLKRISERAEEEREERRKESAIYATTFASISTTIEKQQHQISTQNEDLRQMRTSQLEIRQAQAAQLAILQQILSALHGEGSLPETAATVENHLTRTRDTRVERGTQGTQVITQSQTTMPPEATDMDNPNKYSNAAKDQETSTEPPSGGDR